MNSCPTDYFRCTVSAIIALSAINKCMLFAMVTYDNRAILISMLLDELERQDLKRGLVALSAGANMAVATIIERS